MGCACETVNLVLTWWHDRSVTAQEESLSALKERVAEEIRALAARYKSEGVNQTALASVIGVSQSQISKRLRGKTPFTLTELELIAEFFGVDAAELLGAPRKPSPPGTPVGRTTRQYLDPQLTLIAA